MADTADSPALHDTFGLNSRILFGFLLCVSTVIVLAVILHLYSRCVYRRRRRQEFLGHIHGLGLFTSGDTPLDPVIINSLPIFRFKQTVQLGEIYHSGKSTECSVCLTVLEDEDMARLLPNCRHIFHAECIDKWLSLHSTCPLCRIEAEPRVKPETREGPSMAMFDSPAEHEGRAQDLERQ
ncbi:Arabidopsis Toxicos en Levadura 41 [Hibiscus trionum]|uniref:RING-type E3 ubiquitin transferase n=1 Tax=Hibiscus trionum TaxID=183268 RepID=A0A9W7IM11_HIBTR|nr:Arabidopsis Toxicos en Levadura 41 [Hibiscus trionum]